MLLALLVEQIQRERERELNTETRCVTQRVSADFQNGPMCTAKTDVYDCSVKATANFLVDFYQLG